MSIRSKTDRAIAAYLTGVGVGATVYPANSPGDRAFPCITVKASEGRPNPQFSGVYRCSVTVEIQHTQDNDTGGDGDAARVALDVLTEAVHSAMMQSDNGEDLALTAGAITSAARAKAVSSPVYDADLAAFTCSFWFETGFAGGRTNDEGSAWVELLTFEADVCGKALT